MKQTLLNEYSVVNIKSVKQLLSSLYLLKTGPRVKKTDITLCNWLTDDGNLWKHVLKSELFLIFTLYCISENVHVYFFLTFRSG